MKQQESQLLVYKQFPKVETHRYGIVEPKSRRTCLYEVNRFVEKPGPGTAPSNLAIMGRYVLKPEIFDYLKHKMKAAAEKYN